MVLEQAAGKVAILPNGSKAFFKFALLTIITVGITWFSIYNLNIVYADKDNSIIITKDNVLRDSAGNNAIVGTVKNVGLVPVKINIGVETITKNETTAERTTVLFPTYARTIYPNSETPFKFIIDKNKTVINKPFVMAKIVPASPYYDVV
ncbi:MAG TPA: hypothetical protein VE593_11885, partial [Nitrososphaeraceae archaeon]|nr:hypothetical protein [Nitrososphaeraceae archaeon]